MNSTFLIVLFFLVNLANAFEASACTSPELSKSLIESVEKITTIKTPWNKFEYESLRFIFSTQKSNFAYSYGFNSGELSEFSDISSPCEGTSWAALRLADLAAPVNGMYEPQTPKEEGSTLQKIAFAHKAPVMFMLAEPNMGADINDEFIARIGVHELFHFQYQFGGRFKIDQGYPRDYLDKCALNERWLTSLNSEFVLWNLLLKEWSTLTKSELLEKVQFIISKRAEIATEEEKFCWDATRFWERLEGTAYYVETESAIKAGFSTDEEVRVEESKYLSPTSTTVSTGASEAQQNKVNPGFFYGTGGLYIRAAKQINDDNALERLVESGLSPEEAFTQFFKSHTTR